MNDPHSGHRPGDDVLARHPVSRRLRRRRARAAGISAALSGLRLGRARTGGSLAERARDLPRRRSPRPGSRPATSPRSASPTSARPSLIWDRATGRPIHRAIVWQDRRTAGCAKRSGTTARGTRSPRAPACCSIPISRPPRSPGCWITWTARAPGRGALALRHGRYLAVVAADRRRGARHRRDQRLAHRCTTSHARLGRRAVRLFRVPRAMLPEVRDCAADFGSTGARLLGPRDADPRRCRRPAGGADRAGLFPPGMMKATYGTGCFACSTPEGAGCLQAGSSPPCLPARRGRHYALEGSIFIAGAAVQWLRDGLRLIASAAGVGALAAAADPSQDVYWYRRSSASGRPTGMPRRAGRCSA